MGWLVRILEVVLGYDAPPLNTGTIYAWQWSWPEDSQAVQVVVCI